jgi:hypothetical protein
VLQILIWGMAGALAVISAIPAFLVAGSSNPKREQSGMYAATVLVAGFVLAGFIVYAAQNQADQSREAMSGVQKQIDAIRTTIP